MALKRGRPRNIGATERTFLGSAIKAIREERGWTQSRLARKLGIAQSTQADYELGRTVPPDDRLEEIATILKTKPSEFHQRAEAFATGRAKVELVAVRQPDYLEPAEYDKVFVKLFSTISQVFAAEGVELSAEELADVSIKLWREARSKFPSLPIHIAADVVALQHTVGPNFMTSDRLAEVLQELVKAVTRSEDEREADLAHVRKLREFGDGSPTDK